jgi:membrane-associated phospholipid phosphatase
MIRYIVLGLLICTQVSLAQTRTDSVFTPAAEINLPEKVYPGYPEHDSTWQQGSKLLQEQALPLLPKQPVGSSFKKVFQQPLAVPAFLVGYGLLTLNNPEYLESNEGVQRAITGYFAGFHSGLDNYTRYVPLAAVYGLNLAGVKGRHDLVNLSVIFALSSLLNNTITKNIKDISKERRPDFPSFDAFPSQHTSIAFANAEIMRQEYQGQSGWYSAGGYSFAVATGALRMLNNRHWLSDVAAGAGVGILSTRLVYLIYPWLQENIRLGRLATNNMAIAPMFQEGSYGLSLGFPVDTKKVLSKTH